MTKYWHFFALSFKRASYNLTAQLGTVFYLFILLFVYNQLWSVIGNENQTSNMNTTFIWYLLFGEMIVLSSSRPERLIEEDIKSGTCSYYINKPISFFVMRYSEFIGQMSFAFIFMGLIGSVLAFFLTNGTPFEPKYYPIIFLSTYIGSLINVLFFTSIGFCALWMESTRPMTMVMQKLAFVFGGAIFPLSIYPQWFIDIAKYTPFYAFYYSIIRLTYDFSWYNLCHAFLLCLVWLAVIFGFTYFAYGKLKTRVNLNGG